VLFGLLTSRRLVRRVRRLERATVAVADGDYSVVLPVSGRDEVGRLEANFTTMTSQLGSALAAERQRATGDARAAERARIAREVHDAISQHLFGLRMIAAGMGRADPGNQQARAIERISEEALRDMQALLIELRPASLDGTGLAPALQEVCAAYQDRLGVTVDTHLDDVTVPAPVEHALLRITQEACANAVWHGRASRLTVSVTREDGHVELAVRDTGGGFDPAAPHAGSGLAHIRERAAELGGTVDIDAVVVGDHHPDRHGTGTRTVTAASSGTGCATCSARNRGSRSPAKPETAGKRWPLSPPPARTCCCSTCTCPNLTGTPCSPHCTTRRTGPRSSC
jgi:signal transduction histidine kinase